MSLEFNLDEARQFLELICEGFTPTFQHFPDDKEGKNKGIPGHFTADLQDAEEKLTKLNSQGQGVYVMVNEGDGKGRKEQNVTRVNALFVDLDGSPLQPVLDCSLRPHAITNTSPGRYQAFWLVKNCPLEEFSTAQKSLAAKFKGDTAVHELSRVMRLPGFYNQKPGKNHLVSIYDLEYSQPFDFQTLKKELGLDSFAPTVIKEEPLSPLSELYSGAVTFPSGGRNSTLLRYAARFAHEGKPEAEVYGLTQSVNYLCCKPPLSNEEVSGLVKRAMGYSTPHLDFTGLLKKERPEVEEEEDDDISTEMALPMGMVRVAPGVVGEIAEWITSTISRPQPHFALAAALSFVGVLKGHRVKTVRGNRTNHMTLALGKSGSGKSEVGSRIDDLIMAAGLDKVAMGVAGSDSGLRSAIHGRGGRAYLYWDEMGLAIQGMIAQNSPAYIKAIKDLLIELYTKSGSILRKKELASEAAQKCHHDIIQPCFGLYGTAQPEIFYSALSSAHASDGFFPRLLVFETNNHYPEENPGDKIYTPPPTRLMELCRAIQAMPTNPLAGPGNMEHLMIEPRVVPITPAAQRLWDAAKKDVNDKLTRVSDSLTSGVWARTLAHIEKIALTVEDSYEITADTMTWSIDLMMQLSSSMSAAFKLRVSDSAVEKSKKRVLQVVRDAGLDGATQTHITKRTQWLRDSRERDSILRELELSGYIKSVELASKTRPKRVWVLSKYNPQSDQE